MKNTIAFYSNNRQRIADALICFFICFLYTVLLMYAAYILYEAAHKLVAYFNGCIATANDQLNYCLR